MREIKTGREGESGGRREGEGEGEGKGGKEGDREGEKRGRERQSMKAGDGGSGNRKAPSPGAKSFLLGSEGPWLLLGSCQEGPVMVLQGRKWRLRGTFWSPLGRAGPREVLKSAVWLPRVGLAVHPGRVASRF